jgi:hypothetical protein
MRCHIAIVLRGEPDPLVVTIASDERLRDEGRPAQGWRFSFALEMAPTADRVERRGNSKNRCDTLGRRKS